MIIAAIIVVFAAVAVFTAMSWRRVVPTNEVHVVQSRKDSRPYGFGQSANVYYKIPSFVPFFGVVVSRNPIDIFNVSLLQYDGYDSNKVPFEVDVQAFFQIDNAVEASKRVTDFDLLKEQLDQVLKGGVRKVLASYPIDEIMASRSKLSTEFVEEVSEQTKNWGVKVNSIEFLDIRDSEDGLVITQIMAKEKSTIEKDSRVKCAQNAQIAQTAEIEAQETVAMREVAKNRKVELSAQDQKQAVLEASALTNEKDMAAKRIMAVKAQEIEKEKQIILARAQGEAAQTQAEGVAMAVKAEAAARAEAALVVGKNEATVVQLKGEAEGAALSAKLTAEAKGKDLMAEALKKFNESGISLEQLKAMVEIAKSKYEALGLALSNADLKLVSSGKGMEILGMPMNAESGADLQTFLKESGLQGALGGLLGKLTGKKDEETKE